jgi:hypothetical protein
MGKLFRSISFGLFSSAISGGIVLYFHLDAKVAMLMSLVIGNTAALLFLSGVSGIVGIVIWLSLDFDERLLAAIGKPPLGSLHYERLVLEPRIFVNEGWKTNVRIYVHLKNRNAYAISYVAKIQAQVNGKPLLDSEGKEVIGFSGVVPPEASFHFHYQIPDIPLKSRKASASSPTIYGWALYHVRYRRAGRLGERVTGRTIGFDCFTNLDRPEPADGSKHISEEFDMPVRITDEVDR